MLGLGGFEFDVLGTGFIITGLDNFDLERWTATSTASTPEGSSKDSTALISIQGLWLCDIHFLRELETRVWLKYAVHPGPGSKQKFHAIYDVFHEKSVELRLQFLTGLIYKGVIRVKGWTLLMF